MTLELKFIIFLYSLNFGYSKFVSNRSELYIRWLLLIKTILKWAKVP
jgi:hypothetical protein